jgi:hypothetical protein
MAERRAISRESDRRLIRIEKRVFNGLSAELRAEVKKEIAGITKIGVSILVGIIMMLGGIVVTGNITSAKATNENNRNYKAILDLDLKLEKHMVHTVPGYLLKDGSR